MILTLLKALHIAALILWCAGLLTLPLMLAKHKLGEVQADYTRLRLLTHGSYTMIVTPAAVLAITAGTALIYWRGVFDLWMFAKLVAVGMLVVLHTLIGHTVGLMNEQRGEYAPPSPFPLIAASIAIMLVVLLLVLGKPAMPDVIPAWLKAPQHRQLPLDEMPI